MRDAALTARITPAVRHLASWVRECRLLLGVSQQTIARACGVSQGAMSRLESGRCLSIPLGTYLVVVAYFQAQAASVGMTLPPPSWLLDASLAFAVPELDATRAAILRGFDRCTPTQRDVIWRCLQPLLAAFGARPHLAQNHDATDAEPCP